MIKEKTNEEQLKDKAELLLDAIKLLESFPLSLDTNQELRENIISCGEVLARNITEKTPVNTVIRERAIRKLNKRSR